MILLDDGRIERASHGFDVGFGLRALVGETSRFGFSSDVSPDGLRDLSASLLGGARSRARLDVAPPEAPALATRNARALVGHAESAARALGRRVRQVEVVHRITERRLAVVNADGTRGDDVQRAASLSVTVVAQGKHGPETGFESAARMGGRALTPADAEAVARAAARRALAAATAPPAPAGTMPVVLSSQAGGTFVHEALGHGLEADLLEERMSLYAGHLGKRVGAPLLHVIDDPTFAAGGQALRGGYAIDDEGTPARRTTLVEAGILRGFLYDRLRALRAGTGSTGNGRRESYRHRPIPRMSNLVILPGADDPDAIVRDTHEGLLVCQMGGGEVDTVSGRFVFEVGEAYRIERGAIGPPVRGATLTGHGPTVLRSIDRIGSDLGFAIGICGKDGQDVPVADGQPTLRLPRVTVGGRAG